MSHNDGFQLKLCSEAKSWTHKVSVDICVSTQALVVRSLPWRSLPSRFLFHKWGVE